MVKKILLPTLTLLLLAACNDSHTFKKAEDAQDAGREFIRASLDGNYEKASFYLYPDTTNKNIFGKWKAMHERMNPDEQQKYKDAIKAYNGVLENFSGSPKAPAAQLRKGLALLQLKQTDSGVHELRSLIQRYPQTPEALQARSKLNAMGIRINPRQ